MTLRIVHDSNVVPLDTPNYGDVPACLRRVADEIETGVHGSIFRAVMVLQTEDGSLAISKLGECCSAYELMGLFEAAKLRVFADDAIDDE